MTVQLNPQPTAAVNVVRQWAHGELLLPEETTSCPWEIAVHHLTEASLFWHVAQRPDRHPRVRPVFAVESDGTLGSTTSATRARRSSSDAIPAARSQHPRRHRPRLRSHRSRRQRARPPGTDRERVPAQVRLARRRHPDRRVRRPGSRTPALPGVRVRTDHRLGVRHRRPLRHPLNPLELPPLKSPIAPRPSPPATRRPRGGTDKSVSLQQRQRDTSSKSGGCGRFCAACPRSAFGHRVAASLRVS